MGEHAQHTDDGDSSMLARQVREFRQRLEGAGVTVETDPAVPLTAQFARLQDAVLEALTRGRQAEKATRSQETSRQTFFEHERADEALWESRAKLEAALASMTDAVFISDTAGNFIDFNEAFATFHRFRSKEECARNLRRVPGHTGCFFRQWGTGAGGAVGGAAGTAR